MRKLFNHIDLRNLYSFAFSSRLYFSILQYSLFTIYSKHRYIITHVRGRKEFLILIGLLKNDCQKNIRGEAFDMT